MKFYISFGKLELKYYLYCFLLVILQIYIFCFIYSDKDILISDHKLLDSFSYFFRYFLNIIPFCISHIKSKSIEKPLINKLKKDYTKSNRYIYNKPKEEYLSSIKDFLKIFFICLVILLIEISEIFQNIINNGNDNDNYNKIKSYNDDFIIFEYLIIFLVSKYGEEIYYKHHYVSFFILTLVEANKDILFLIEKSYKNFNIKAIILSIINSFLYAIFFLYIKRLMKYNFISPPKCNFLIGIIDTPLIIIIYFVISYTSLGNKSNKYYIDNIFELFEIENYNTKNIIHLTLLPLAYGLYVFIIAKIINHLFITIISMI